MNDDITLIYDFNSIGIPTREYGWRYYHVPVFQAGDFARRLSFNCLFNSVPLLNGRY